MNLVGTPDEWVDLLDTCVPEILDLVISTWNAMPSPAPDAREDPTTDELCKRLQQNRNSCNLPFQIRPQIVELEPQSGENPGRMDITFIPPVAREDIYFSLECKRLNVVKDGKVRPYSSEYVTQGMMRFIRGQYAKRVRHGAMLGYVLDGDVAKAIKNVVKAIKDRFEDLGMEAPGEMLPSSISPKNLTLKETRHTRTNDLGTFQMHHIFAAGSSST